MKDQIITILSEQLNPEIVKDLINSYEATKTAYIKGESSISISKAGLFVDNLFILLEYIQSKKRLNEIKLGESAKISERLKSDTNIPESIRILIPKIAVSLIYEPRSKLGAVHKKPIDPDFIDARLVITACDWIISELLRTYYTREPERVDRLIKEVVKDYIPLTTRVGAELFINSRVTSEDEVLIRLFNSGSEGISREELGKSMKSSFDPSTITRAIKKLASNKSIHKTNQDLYIISEPGKRFIGEKLIKLSEQQNIPLS